MQNTRSDALDALRGMAMVWMCVYHFCFDLQWIGWLRLDMLNDPVWTLQRTGILSLFLLCAGMGQVLSPSTKSAGLYGRRFVRRCMQVAACAACVSLGSWWLFGTRFIYFGVLHGLVCMLLISRPLRDCRARVLVGLGALCWLLAALAPGLHALWPALRLFNEPAWSILGFISVKPLTEDYVPLLPWLGVLLGGMALGQYFRARHSDGLYRKRAGLQPLAQLGRWSLRFYMLHQPVLIGLLLLVQSLLHRAP